MRTKSNLSEFRAHKHRILTLRRFFALVPLSAAVQATFFTLSLIMLSFSYHNCNCQNASSPSFSTKSIVSPIPIPHIASSAVSKSRKRNVAALSDSTETHVEEEHNEKNSYAIPQYATKRHMKSGHEELSIPSQCALWRELAHDTKRLHLYDKHFTSLDVTDWFVYTMFFNESFHNKRQHGRRPRYLDIAANHAKRWSNTWFLDRCLGWDGVCAEANPKYHQELMQERHCHLVDTCLSDEERFVKFSFTDAYGGVVRGKDGFGVDASQHASEEKYRGQFVGVREIKCRTARKVLRQIGMEGRVEFMSLDVEGYELPILKGIDWDKVQIDVIVMENKQRIVREFLLDRGYVLFENVLKDLIFVRKGSGFGVSDEMRKLMRRFDRKSRRFEGISNW